MYMILTPKILFAGYSLSHNVSGVRKFNYVPYYVGTILSLSYSNPIKYKTACMFLAQNKYKLEGDVLMITSGNNA